MMWLLVVLLGIYLRELRTENVYGLLSSPSFVKRGLGGDLTIATYLNESPQPLFTKERLFYDVTFNILWEYLRGLRAESIYLPIKYPLFRKEGAGGDFLLQLIQNQFPHHFNMRFFSIQCRDIVIRHTTVI